MIVLVKDAFNKVIGCQLLLWQELEDVVLNMETTLNDWPLSYMEDDVALPILTPDSMMLPNIKILPDLQPHNVEPNIFTSARMPCGKIVI